MNDKMCSSFCMFSLGIRCLEKWSRLLSNITLSLFMTHLWNWKICYGPVFCYQPRSMVPAQHPPATSAVGPAENYISTPLIPSLRILGVSSQPAGLSSPNHRSCRLLEELVEEVLICFLPATLRAGSESYTACRDGATSSTALPSAAGSGSYTAHPHNTCSASFVKVGWSPTWSAPPPLQVQGHQRPPRVRPPLQSARKNHGLRLHCLGSFGVTGSQLQCSLCSAPPS